MPDDGVRFIDDSEGTRFGYQPKVEKKFNDGHKPKDNPAPINPPHGKKSDAGTSSPQK